LRTDLIAAVPELLRRHTATRGGKLAYRDAHGALTYAELEARTARLAGHLADLGIGPGDTVAMLLPNSVTWIETSFAVTRADAVSVPINYESTEPEIAYRLADANCKAIVTTKERSALVAKLRADAPNLKITILTVHDGAGAEDLHVADLRLEDLRYDDLIANAPRSAPRDRLDIHAPAYIVYTSGTTGRAKGVLLTVHGMLWVVAACWAPIAGLSERDTVLSPLPLFHSYALNLSVLGILATGASEYIMEKYSTSEAVRLLKSGEFTLFPGVPTMFHYFLQAAQSDAGLKFPNLRLCLSAGAIMPATLNRAFEERLGIALLDGYGITETSTMVTLNWPTGGRVLGACGLPLPGLAVRIVDPLTDKDRASGEEGELIVRGPNVMPGYHNKPEETEKALRDGWYRTGDLARSDENGYLTITGRLKDLIIRGGQNIAPAEIEEAVNTFGPVLDCAVVGVAHDHLGEVPVLFVVPRAGAAFEVEMLLGHCRSILSSYKIPHAVHVIGEIPRTGSGKIIRYKLREILQQQSA
jgi:acyl-CoA synthetase (AMP-forming)/AMP-acid ligase II